MDLPINIITQHATAVKIAQYKREARSYNRLHIGAQFAVQSPYPVLRAYKSKYASLLWMQDYLAGLVHW